METDLDHIHFLISYLPKTSISSIVLKLKQESTILIWRKHSSYLVFHFWKENTFWSDGYFVSSIGEACSATIENYIRTQG